MAKKKNIEKKSLFLSTIQFKTFKQIQDTVWKNEGLKYFGCLDILILLEIEMFSNTAVRNLIGFVRDAHVKEAGVHVKAAWTTPPPPSKETNNGT